MQLHLTSEKQKAKVSFQQSPAFPKDIQCDRCGFQYKIFAAVLSSECRKCAAIAVHIENYQDQNRLFISDPQKQEAPIFLRSLAKDLSRLEESFVNELSYTWQNEWQLWAKVVENFLDPNYHAAYLALVARQDRYSEALQRYQDHFSLYSAQTYSEKLQRWICEEMCEKIEAFGLIAIEQESRSFRNPLLSWAFPLKQYRNSFRFLYLYLGFSLMAFVAVHYIF